MNSKILNSEFKILKNMSRKLVIDPVTRVEGHGKVTVNLDENNKVTDAKFHIVEFALLVII